MTYAPLNAMRYRGGQVNVVRSGAPERIYDSDAADPEWKPRPVGFTAVLDEEYDDTINDWHTNPGMEDREDST